VHKGVVVVTSTPPTLQQRCVALCAAHPGGFVTGPTGGALLHLRRMPASAAVHFSVRHGAKVPEAPGLLLRQTTKLSHVDRHVRADGLVVASWARLAFDLAADLRPLDHLSVLHQLLNDGRVTADELIQAGRRLVHPARRGSSTFLRSLTQLGAAAFESHHEVVLADALRRRNVPVEAQTRLERLPDGRTVRIDLAVPAVKWGVELDVHPEHHTMDGAARDARRLRQVHMVGWQVERVTELDLQDVEHLADELATLYHLRRRAVTTADPRVSVPAPVRECLG
jgi:very-short-patch-repair endonuclease